MLIPVLCVGVVLGFFIVGCLEARVRKTREKRSQERAQQRVLL